MDPQAQPQPVQTPPPVNSFEQPPKKRKNPFTLIVKIVLFFLIAVGLLLGGFYLGEQGNKIPTPTPSPTIVTALPSSQPTETLPSITPASQNTKPVKAGLGDDTTVFEPYSIDIPADWTDARETTVAAGIDKLTLTKNGYSITIYQAPMGGGGCVYEGDKPNEFAQLYTNFVDINGKGAQYRRSWNDSAGQSVTYTICQKTQDNAYSVMSTFGAISVVSPNPATAAILTEIDGMIASLIKQ